MPLAAVPTLIHDRYEVGPLLGTGGMAAVYEGTDRRLRRPVAIKLLRPDLATDASLRHRFTIEARTAARISHPNVVAVFDAGEDDGVPFIVMERLSSRTLADDMASGPMAISRARSVAVDVLAALQAAHALGVLHRDIKPANVLLAADGSAKVGDFGIAKAAEEGDVTSATAVGTVIGTPAYLAPERLCGAAASAASDVYSVGVVLYEALAGVQPYVGATPGDVASAIVHTEPVPLLERRPEVGAALAAVVARAMAKDPAVRYADASAMAEALASATDVGATAALPVVGDTSVIPLVAAPLAASPSLARTRRRLIVPAVAIALAVIAVAALALSARSDPGTVDTTPTTTAPVVADATTTTAPATVTPTTVAQRTPPHTAKPKHGKADG